MATSSTPASDKLDEETKRVKSRSFGGYLADRVLGRADFAKAPAPEVGVAGAKQKLEGRAEQLRKQEEAAGLRRGGSVKGKPAVKKPAVKKRR